MRLHPVKDGLIPQPHERGMTKRDRAGNRLIDVVDPRTGFCVGVRSPLTVRGPVTMASPMSGGNGPDVRFDPSSHRYYELVRDAVTDPIGFVVRLVTDGDNFLPCSRVRIIRSTTAPSAESGRKSTAPVRKPLSVREQNDLAAKSVLSAMGYTGPFTPEVRNAALAMIEIEKNTAVQLRRNKSEERALRRQATRPL